MTIAYNWTVEQLRCLPQSEGQTKVVTEAHWRCTATQEQDGKSYSSTNYGACSFTYKGGDFIDYDSLTLDDVLSWIWASNVEKTEIESRLSLNIADLVNPPIITPPLPWSQA